MCNIICTIKNCGVSTSCPFQRMFPTCTRTCSSQICEKQYIVTPTDATLFGPNLNKSLDPFRDADPKDERRVIVFSGRNKTVLPFTGNIIESFEESEILSVKQ